MTTLTLTDAECDLVVEILEQARDNADDDIRECDEDDAKPYRARRATCIELLFRLGVMTLMDEDEDDRP
jgi:hypothetical protein